MMNFFFLTNVSFRSRVKIPRNDKNFFYMCATLWQITARYLRIEKLNFSMHSLFRFEKKKRKKMNQKGASLFSTFLQSKQLLQKG